MASKVTLAGSNQIAHIVDCVLTIESDEETPLKFLRASKNRFGDTNEVGVFQHVDNGLAEVSDPSGIFLETNDDNITGTSCSFISEGARQIPVEIQALVTHTTLPTPRKQFNGIQYQRGQIVCAILDKFCSARLSEKDVFVNTVSGIKILDPQADLAIAASILSSAMEKPISSEIAFIGELSLTGQVRGANMIETKLREASRLGFTTAIIPSVAMRTLQKKNYDINIKTIKNINELMNLTKMRE